MGFGSVLITFGLGQCHVALKLVHLALLVDLSTPVSVIELVPIREIINVTHQYLQGHRPIPLALFGASLLVNGHLK